MPTDRTALEALADFNQVMALALRWPENDKITLLKMTTADKIRSALSSPPPEEIERVKAALVIISTQGIRDHKGNINYPETILDHRAQAKEALALIEKW